MKLPDEVMVLANEAIDRLVESAAGEAMIIEAVEAAYARGVADGTILAKREAANFLPVHIRDQIEAAVRHLVK